MNEMLLTASASDLSENIPIAKLSYIGYPLFDKKLGGQTYNSNQ